MDRFEVYRHYLTKEYMMGPNSIRLMDELLRSAPAGTCFDRTLDLGCGTAISSVFTAKEAPAKQVFALDLWMTATDNYRRICESGLGDRVIPIHGNALEMPFADKYFDAIVSVDSYHYFGCEKGVFAEKILPRLKVGGTALIAVPGLTREPEDELRKAFQAWATDGDDETFKTVGWWEALLKSECGDTCDIAVTEAECCETAWEEWFQSGHEFALRDQQFYRGELKGLLNFVMMYIRRKA